MRTLAKKGPFSFGSLYDPPTMAGITVLVMKGGHDERVERGGERGGSEAVRSGLPKKWRQHASMHPWTACWPAHGSAIDIPWGGSETRRTCPVHEPVPAGAPPHFLAKAALVFSK